MRPPSWPTLVIIAGGVLMALLYPVYTTLHGPTSFYHEGHLFGLDGLQWGCLMEAPASLLIAGGLFGLHQVLVGQGGRMARIGFWLILIGLLIPALVDLVTFALAPPFLLPVTAIGLTLVALGNRQNPAVGRSSRVALLVMGLLLALSFGWALVPVAATDPVGGYRIFGVMADLLFGVGWIVFGVSLRREKQAV